MSELSIGSKLLELNLTLVAGSRQSFALKFTGTNNAPLDLSTTTFTLEVEQRGADKIYTAVTEGDTATWTIDDSEANFPFMRANVSLVATTGGDRVVIARGRVEVV